MSERIDLNQHGNGKPFDVLVLPPGQPLPGTGEIPYIPGGPAGQPEAPKHPRPPATPELDRWHHIIEGDGHKAVQAFMEWLDYEAREKHGYALVKFKQGEPVELGSTQYEQVLAHFYGLDLDKIHAEQEALLAYMRELNAQ